MGENESIYQRFYELNVLFTKRNKQFEWSIEDELASGRLLLNVIENTRIKIMTPQEELFAQLFNHEKVSVQALVEANDLLAIRARRDEMAKIAFEARARMQADDEAEREVKTRIGPKKGGIDRSVETDDVTSDVINTIKERQKKLSKDEKLIQTLMKNLKCDEATARKMLSPATLLEVREGKAKEVGERLAEDKKEESTADWANPFKVCDKCKQNPCRCDGLTPVSV